MAAVRNNGGGHYNHSLFWTVMAPNGGGASLKGNWPQRSTTAFGLLRCVQGEVRRRRSHPLRQRLGVACAFTKAASWSLLSTPNQDNPLMPNTGCGGTPILGHGRVGTCLLPPLPEPPSRLHHRVVERGELERGGPSLRRRQVVRSFLNGPDGASATVLLLVNAWQRARIHPFQCLLVAPPAASELGWQLPALSPVPVAGSFQGRYRNLSRLVDASGLALSPSGPSGRTGSTWAPHPRCPSSTGTHLRRIRRARPLIDLGTSFSPRT
jgi:superoxide dismutase